MTPSPQTPASWLRFLQQWTSLGGLLRYGWFFSAFLVFLPLTAIDDVPLHGVLGGLFVDLTAWEIYFVTMAFLGLAWSLMFTEGLIVNGIESWWSGGLAYQRLDETSPTGYVPAWAEKFFSVPVTPPQFVFFSLLVVPGLFVVVQHAAAGVTAALLAAGLGVVTAYLLLILLSAPAAIVDQDDRAMVDLPLTEPIWAALGSIRPLVSAVEWLRGVVSAILAALGLRYMLRPSTTSGGPPVVHAPHFIAITNATGLIVLIAVVAFVFSPASPDRKNAIPEASPVPGAPAPALGRVIPAELPAVMYLYIIGITLVLTLTSLQFHLGRLRVSPIATLLVIVILGYGWSAVDHYFVVVPRPPPRPEDALTPITIARGTGKNLVVVVASGGGILAAGWTTLALEKLIEARPDLLREIRLLSTISGGSVGAAYFLDSVLRGEPPVAAKVKSTTSSLSVTAYGFAFLDLPRLVSGGAVSSARDRGILLENEWLAIANGTVRGAVVDKKPGGLTDRSLSSLRGAILRGTIPAPIFGATIMESGRRVMITPIDFPGQADRRRGETLSEFLLDGDEADVSLWTAARLSATFAFVSPAARAEIAAAPKGAVPPRHQAHHMIDGGYYDNFGVTSALDWLAPVLQARERRDKGLDFERVLVIQLRAFRRGSPKELPARTGAIAALLGPVIGLEAIRDGAAVSRNDIELARFAAAWKTRVRAVVPDRRFDICLATLQPPGVAGPLSWHLSAEDKKRLENSWTPLDAARVIAYLDGTGPCPEPVD